MRLPYLILTLLLVFNVFIDVYIYKCISSAGRGKTWRCVQLWSAVLFALLFISVLVMPVRSATNSMLVGVMWMIFVYGSVYVSKFVFVAFDALSRLPRLFKRGQWRWLSMTGLGISVITFLCMWWGALVTRLSLDTVDVTYTDCNLPAGLDGFRIAQISDIHLSTYDGDTAFVHKLVEHINSLDADIVVFTGDMVSRNSDEAEAYVAPLSRLHARYGVYSVLGNHDYGDYEDWPSAAAKAKDHSRLIELQRRMGWRLLRDETARIPVNGDTLVLIGVENIGRPPFKAYGNLRRAYETPGDNRFKVLLSHDPSHWENEIKDNPENNINLTLSGHTHAMQMEFFGKSPASAVHKYWSGMYTDKYGKGLYVNIGTGTVGYPARMGSARPEITLITLKRG